MRRLGLSLLWLGAGIGAATGVGMLAGAHPASWSWLVAVGMEKLAGIGSVGMMSAGAVCLRLHNRAERRDALVSGQRET